MSTFSINLRIVTTIMCLISAIMLTHMGYSYIHVGYGLIPWIAFPVAFVVAMFCPMTILWELCKEADNHNLTLDYTDHLQHTYPDSVPYENLHSQVSIDEWEREHMQPPMKKRSLSEVLNDVEKYHAT